MRHATHAPRLIHTDAICGLTKKHSAWLTDQRRRALPTRNYSAGVFAGLEHQLEAFKERLKKRACFQCAIACRNSHGTTFDATTCAVRARVRDHRPLRVDCCIDVIDALMKFNGLCDELGMDTISTGSVTALGHELDRAWVRRLEPAVRRRRELCEGSGIDREARRCGRRAGVGRGALAAKYGHPALSMEVKNLASGYDHVVHSGWLSNTRPLTGAPV